jgi:hypothetical protein
MKLKSIKLNLHIFAKSNMKLLEQNIKNIIVLLKCKLKVNSHLLTHYEFPHR